MIAPRTETAPVEDLIAAMKAGEMVILVDRIDRENEGDFVMAAEKADAAAINRMALEGRGLICAPVAPHIADRLELPPMTEQPSDPRECAFTISVDARVGTTTGISAADRALTCRLLVDDSARPTDFNRPGHIFPLRARAGGVLERPGHTEAAVDLARYAGLSPAGVICEIMNPDGTMARTPQLIEYARKTGTLLGSINDLIEYRKEHPLPALAAGTDRPALRHRSSANIPTPLGVFKLHVFENDRDQELVALTLGDLREEKRKEESTLVRVHSACFTGDVLGSLRCDCGGQLHMALEQIGEAGTGMLIYLPQEGRGIGLASKIDAYRLQEEGLDTVEANARLGFDADLRTYEDAASVLGWFGVKHVSLLTNNPAKMDGLRDLGIDVTDRVAIEAGPGPCNHDYLRAKKSKLGHLFRAI